MRNVSKTLVATALGAVAMYYLDPERGHRRRARVRHRLEQVSQEVGDFVHEQGQRTAEQARELAASMRRAFPEAARTAPHGPRRERGRPERPTSHPDAPDKAKAARAGMSPGTLAGPLFKGAALCAAVAAALYCFDPQKGRQRRAQVRSKFGSLSRDAGDYVRTRGQRAAERFRGVAASVGTPFAGRSQSRSDMQLRKHISLQLGRLVSHPEAIEVTVNQGRVSLHGPVLAGEVDPLLSAVQTMPGVRQVENRLEVHDEPGGLSGRPGRERVVVIDASTCRPVREAGILH